MLSLLLLWLCLSMSSLLLLLLLLLLLSMLLLLCLAMLSFLAIWLLLLLCPAILWYHCTPHKTRTDQARIPFSFPTIPPFSTILTGSRLHNQLTCPHSTSVRSLCWKVSCIPHSHHC